MMAPLCEWITHLFILTPAATTVRSYSFEYRENKPVQLKPVKSGAPNEKMLAKYLKCHFLLFRLFQSLLKAYLCKPIQVGLFGVFS